MYDSEAHTRQFFFTVVCLKTKRGKRLGVRGQLYNIKSNLVQFGVEYTIGDKFLLAAENVVETDIH